MTPELLARAQAGAPHAQQAVLAELGPRLAGLVRRLCAPGELEDCTQELFMHLLDVLPRFKADGPAQLSTWAFAVAHRFMMMRHRRQRPELVSLDHASQVPQPLPSAEGAVDARTANQALLRELEILPAERRRVFVLACLYGHPLEEIAAVEQVPVGTVKSRLHRARAELLLRLGDQLDFLQGEPRAVATRR